MAHLHRVSELTSGKIWVIVDSPTYPKKRYVVEFSTAVNNNFWVKNWVEPNYVGKGKGHDLFRPQKLLRSELWAG